ncbi:MAG: YcfL family protein [Planctomycetota bacterium]
MTHRSRIRSIAAATRAAHRPVRGRLVTPLVLCFAGLVTLGCETVNTVEREDPLAAPVVVEDKRITTDVSLQMAASVIGVIEGETEAGFPKVQAELYNWTSERKRVHYRFDWIDVDGFVIDSPLASWQAIALAGKERDYIISVAPTKSAVDFRLKLLEPER